MLFEISFFFPILSKHNMISIVLSLKEEENEFVFVPVKDKTLLLLITVHLKVIFIVLISVEEYSQFSLFNVIF